MYNIKINKKDKLNIKKALTKQRPFTIIKTTKERRKKLRNRRQSVQRYKI